MSNTRANNNLTNNPAADSFSASGDPSPIHLSNYPELPYYPVVKGFLTHQTPTRAIAKRETTLPLLLEITEADKMKSISWTKWKEQPSTSCTTMPWRDPFSEGRKAPFFKCLNYSKLVNLAEMAYLPVDVYKRTINEVDENSKHSLLGNVFAVTIDFGLRLIS